MFNRFLNTALLPFAKFNANNLLVASIVKCAVELIRDTKTKFDNSPPDDPETLGEAEYQSRRVIRQAFQDLGLNSSYAKLRFSGNNSLLSSCSMAEAQTSYFNPQGEIFFN